MVLARAVAARIAVAATFLLVLAGCDGATDDGATDQGASSTASSGSSAPQPPYPPATGLEKPAYLSVGEVAWGTAQVGIGEVDRVWDLGDDLVLSALPASGSPPIVAVVDELTGTPRWTSTDGAEIPGLPGASANAEVAVAPALVRTTAYDAATGRELWHLDGIRATSVGDVVILASDPTAPVTALNGLSGMRGIDPATGEVIWARDDLADGAISLVTGGAGGDAGDREGL